MTKKTANKIISSKSKIAVVIPCYRECNHILDVVKQIGDEVEAIYIIDDACPDSTGKFVTKYSSDKRIHVLHHTKNRGVGGATLTGYRRALDDGYEVIVKIDGDGQMDPTLILTIANPVIEGRADYSKGNRFHRSDYISSMPLTRIFGNI